MDLRPSTILYGDTPPRLLGSSVCQTDELILELKDLNDIQQHLLHNLYLLETEGSERFHPGATSWHPIGIAMHPIAARKYQYDTLVRNLNEMEAEGLVESVTVEHNDEPEWRLTPAGRLFSDKQTGWS